MKRNSGKSSLFLSSVLQSSFRTQPEVSFQDILPQTVRYRSVEAVLEKPRKTNYVRDVLQNCMYIRCQSSIDRDSIILEFGSGNFSLSAVAVLGFRDEDSALVDAIRRAEKEEVRAKVQFSFGKYFLDELATRKGRYVFNR